MGEGERVAVGDSVPLPVPLRLGEGDGVPLAVGEGDRVPLAVGEGEPEGVGEGVPRRWRGCCCWRGPPR